MREDLSEREVDVGRLLARGVCNKEIARALGVEVVTVKKHVGNILQKLGARNRTQAALMLAKRPWEGVSSSRERMRKGFSSAGPAGREFSDGLVGWCHTEIGRS